MSKQLNEIKRLQRLASILKENSVEIDAKFIDDFKDAILEDDPNAKVEQILKLSPKEINDGYCHFWAEAFVENFGGKHKYSNDFSTGSGGHHWVELNGKFYDAETPQGVSSLKGLPFVQRDIDKWLKDKEIQNF